MIPNYITNLFSLKGIEQILNSRQMVRLATNLAMLSLFGLTACLQVPAASIPVAEEFAQAAAPAAVPDQATAPDLASLAENPELLKVHPPAKEQEMTGSALLAANPELALAGRYTDLVKKRAEAANLAANPELLKAHPPTLVEAVSESAFLANNPELMVASRYTTGIELTEEDN